MRFPNRLYSRIVTLLLFAFLALACVAADQYPKRPLNDRVVVALVAGAALPESMVADIQVHGLNFHPSEQYLSRLAQIGANAAVIDTLKKAKVTAPEKGDSHPDDATVLEHLFLAGEKLKAKSYIEAAKEVTSASRSLEDHPEMAFVVGQIMWQEETFAPASVLYSKLIDLDPEFPEVHSKFSFVLYRIENNERGVAEAKAALARMPNNAEAHKNMAVNLEAMKQFDAAIAEYQTALMIKPDYTAVHGNLGVLYHDRGEYRKAIAEYRKSLAFDPADAMTHHNISLDLKMVDELGTAMSELKEAIRLGPNHPHWRMELADLLVDAGDRDGGIEEFRKLIRMSPDSSYCHSCFGALLWKADRVDEAAREYRIAIQLDAEDADSHYGLGLILNRKNQQDEALKELLEATKLGYDSWGVHQQLANIYFARKQYDDAATEIKQAISIDPSNGFLHEQLADILVALGKTEEASQEYREAVGFQGRDTSEASDADRKLGALYEKLGRYSAALLAYRGMYEAFPCEKTKADYEAARSRLSSHLPLAAVQDSPAASNESPEASSVRWVEKSKDMQIAMTEKRWKDADELGNEAIAVAEQMQPQDGRLVATIGLMGMNYRMQKRFDEAEQQYLKALKVSEKLLGTTNLQTMYALSALGQFYFETKNYPQTVEYMSRSLALAQTLYGPTYGYELLDMIAQAYKEQHMFDKAEDAYKRMLAADETKNGPSSPSSAAGLEHLGVLYCDMGKYEDARSSLERAVAIEQKQFGPNSPSLDRPLNELARALRGLGKQDEAKALDHRRELLAQNQTR
jgi:tetratricopeptide (TPR) repeat protein